MFDLNFLHWFLVVFLFALGTTYLWMRNKFKYWTKYNIDSLTPTFPFGNFGPMMVGKESIGMSVQKTYNACKNSGKYCGYFLFGTPGLVVTDPEAIKIIMVKDFQFFHDRGIFYNEKHDPISANLFAIEGDKWRKLRAKLSPTFTSGKLKTMFYTMLESVSELQMYIQSAIQSQSELEIKDILARFTTDIIGSCALGIQCNSLKNPKAEFREIGEKIMTPSIWQTIKGAFAMTFRTFARHLRIVTNDSEVSHFFLHTVQNTIRYRKNNNIERKYFMQLLLKLKDDNTNGDDSQTSLTMEEIAAQAFIFFLGGFETSSSAMSFCLFELALNPEIQTRARDEINRVTNKNSGKISYEALVEMVYLDMAISGAITDSPQSSDACADCINCQRHADSILLHCDKLRVMMAPFWGLQRLPNITS
ncbi:probable cytochrome P450 6a20 [Ctenocephalides felis]|uniref:probable cytochrome P450 6a20 n=1 Tax=Ctenocephalides felis TaxID=7515 RepID=UPI000E6E4AAE|nr:probable cytochrome P450 6a20 [Ctenocephalides felis]